MRLGIFGGSFDPPHVGHLLAASDAFEALRLDRLLFVPASIQPLKAGAEAAPAGLRVRMVEALVGDDPRFAVDTVEVTRAGVSFMIDTLDELGRAHSGASLYLIVGMDVLDSFEKWRDPEGVLSRARLAVVRRPGIDAEPALRGVRALAARAGREEPVVLETRLVDVSSTEVRARVRAGLPVRGFVPDAVAAVIAAAGLYRQGN